MGKFYITRNLKMKAMEVKSGILNLNYELVDSKLEES